MNRYRLTIGIRYIEDVQGFEPIVIEFEARWTTDADIQAAALLKAYPDWEFWRLERMEWNEVDRKFRR